jgi:hypothetical protein
VSAGRVIFIGFICFMVWLVLDAKQLYISAQASPPGARRTVSMTILRPIADVAGALGLSSFEDGAKDALGQRGPPPGSVTVTTFPPFPGLTDVDTHPGSAQLPDAMPVSGMVPVPRGLMLLLWERSHPASGGLPPLVQPTAAHPLSVLEIGDSLGVDLGYGLEDTIGTNPLVHLQTAGHIDTGLVNSAYWNWPGHLAADLNLYHPRVVVIMMVANDVESLFWHGQHEDFGTPGWDAAYGARVALMADMARAAGARVLWVGMPPMAPPEWVTTADMETINGVVQTVAKTRPWMTYFSSFIVLAGPHGSYEAVKQNSSGEEVQIRTPDGLHMDSSGYDMLASALVAPMEQAWHIRL